MVKMGSRALLMLAPSSLSSRLLINHFPCSGFREALRVRNYSVHASLERPNVTHLAKTARISLTPHEAEEFGPKIQQVVEWFGQLQEVDLHSIEPAIRADTEVGNFREDSPEIFDNREAMIAAVPSYEEPYIKVPNVLNKD